MCLLIDILVSSKIERLLLVSVSVLVLVVVLVSVVVLVLVLISVLAWFYKKRSDVFVGFFGEGFL